MDPQKSDETLVPEVISQETALMQITKGEVDMQVSTAKRFPRDVTRFLSNVRALALLDKDVAASLTYALPRGGKTISGPSVRFAEIIASSWGNLRVEQRILEADDKHITAQATCWDLETNVAMKAEVKRRITNRQGHRFNDDMIVVTGNAAAAIALRNAVFKVVPLSLVKPILTEADKLCRGDAKSLAEHRTKTVEHLTRYGVTEARVLALIEKAGVADISWEDIKTLRGLATAINEGTTTVEEAFPEAVDLDTKGKQSFADQMAPKKTEKPKDEGAPTPASDEEGLGPDEDIPC